MKSVSPEERVISEAVLSGIKSRGLMPGDVLKGKNITQLARNQILPSIGNPFTTGDLLDRKSLYDAGFRFGAKAADRHDSRTVHESDEQDDYKNTKPLGFLDQMALL